jgi:hypothetical protein
LVNIKIILTFVSNKKIKFMNSFLRVFAFLALIFIVMFGFKMCEDATNVVEKEYSPSALLKKYEYFKDLSSAIDEKRATIDVYESQLSGVKDHESFQYQQTQAEMMGLISMHNSLCAEYNSAMSKFNYAFCNKGDLPASNLEPLPREIKPYISSIN